ncbi:MAG: MaoC/PaaZ C-terminal domain-containing protein [Haloglomus sp.]
MTDPDNETDSMYEQIAEGDTDTTGGRTITEADIANFAGVSGDFNHLHMDAEAMQDSMFGERIAHGMLVLSAATGLLWQHRTPAERDAVVAFYGMDDLRFRGPVFAGDTIHLETEVVEKRESDHPKATGTVKYDVEVKKQDGSVVISCSMLSLVE